MKRKGSFALLLTLLCVLTTGSFATHVSSVQPRLTGNDEEDWNNLLNSTSNYMLKECPNLLDEATNNDMERFEAVACAKQSFLTLLAPCLENFPEVWNPLRCTFETFFTEEQNGFIAYFSKDSAKSEDAGERLSVQGIHFFQDLVWNQPEKAAYFDNQDTCQEYFGSYEAPTIISCVSLLGLNSLETFLGHLRDGFQFTDSCASMKDVMDFNEATLNYAWANEFDFNITFKEITAKFVEKSLQTFFKAFDNCTEVNDGPKRALHEKFEEHETGNHDNGAQTIALGVIEVLVFAAALINLAQ